MRTHQAKAANRIRRERVARLIDKALIFIVAGVLTLIAIHVANKAIGQAAFDALAY